MEKRKLKREREREWDERGSETGIERVRESKKAELDVEIDKRRVS